MEFKQLEWEYFTPPKKSGISTVHAVSKMKLPEWSNEFRNIKIEISESHCSDKVSYFAGLWAFNRGIALVLPDECFSVSDCIDLCNTRLEEFASVFYNCR